MTCTISSSRPTSAPSTKSRARRRPLIVGPIDPHDVLAALGIKELQRSLVDKIQEVYRSQSVAINDKHIKVICRQMLRSVCVTRVGDTDFLVHDQVDRFRFMEENEKSDQRKSR